MTVRIYDFSCVVLWIALCTFLRICVRKIYAQKLAYELSWIVCLVRRTNMRHYAKCCADRSNCCRDIVIFKLLGCWPSPSSISLDLTFVTDQTVTRAELCFHAKFSWNRWNCGWDMTSFPFLKMAAAMLDFWNYKFLTVGCIVSVELRHHAKFRSDRSHRCRDISIMVLFKMAAATILDFYNFTFLRTERSRKMNCVSVPNFVEIIQTTAEIR